MLSDGVTRKILSNGLTVLLKENHSWPVVAIFTYVKAGYFNEPDHLVGISHMIEHMFFKGTKRRGVAQIANETKALGGILNASTIYDHTLYYTVLPSERLREGLDIQSDALLHSAFDPEELRKETEVVIQEAKRKLDMPSSVAREKLFELAFSKHRMRRWRIGSEEGLRSFSREDYLTFYRDLYRPENIVLAVVGAVETPDAMAEIESLYENFERGVLKKQESPTEPAQKEFKYRFMSGDINQCYLNIGFHTPGIFDPDSYALEILAFILGRGRSSDLFQNVKERDKLVNSIAASNYALKELGIFVIEANVAPQKLRNAEEAIFSQVARTRSQGVTTEQVHKARNILESIYHFSLATASGQASILAEFEALGDFRLADDYLKQLYRVTEGDVLKVARAYLTRGNCSLLEYVPLNSSLEAQAPGGAAEKFPNGAHVTSIPVFLDKAETSKERKRVISAIVNDGREKEIVRLTMGSGMTVLIKENHQRPLVSVGIFARGGRAKESEANAGISGLSLRTTLKGTENRSASQVAREIENLGSSIHFSNDADYSGYSMNVLAKNFDAGFEILADVVTAPAFLEEELAKEKDNVRAQLLREKDDMFRYPLRLFYSSIFKNHPYGLPVNGRAELIEGMTSAQLYDWHAGQFAPQNLVVVLVGDVASGKIKDVVEARFSLVKHSAISTDREFTLPIVSGIEETLEVRDKVQTALVLGFRGPKYAEADYYSLTVLQNAISGLGGRFFEELRSRQSLAYTVSAFVVARKQAGAFLSYIATSPDKEEVAKEGLLKEFAQLTEAPISREELTRAVRYTTGTHKIALETNQAQMAQYAHDELLGNDPAETNLFSERISAVTTDDVLSAAQKYFDPDRYALGLLRGRQRTKSSPT